MVLIPLVISDTEDLLICKLSVACTTRNQNVPQLGLNSSVLVKDTVPIGRNTAKSTWHDLVEEGDNDLLSEVFGSI